MKTLRDTNNNNSNTKNNHSGESHFSSKLSPTINHHHHQPRANIDANSYPSLLTSNTLPSTTIPNVDPNQLSSIIQTYLSKLTNNPIVQPDSINPLVYFQLLNTNALLMQQLNVNLLSSYNSVIDPSTENIHSGKKSQNLSVDSTVYVPKTRPMTQDEIAEHARLVYQRALQRNQLQQHNDLMKHFYETLNIKPQVSSHTTQQSLEQHDVPSVPHVSNIASIGTFDVLDTMVKSASSSLSMKEPGINAAASSFSLLSADDSKMSSSVLDPGAPVFIPRQSRQKLDDDNETSSSSSDSDFNDFHYLDQFLDEFYNSDHRYDNHLIIPKSTSSDPPIIGDEISTMNSKYSIHPHVLGQGDGTEQSPSKPEHHYSIHQLLDRYRNPRCHLVLPEWSRLSLILPNVCSMRAHTYKIKRYFAYRRRLADDPNLVNLPIQS